MIRLTLFLCAGIFAMLLVLGEDRGQRRQGLMVADTGPQSASPIGEAVPDVIEVAVKPLNLPAQPVMQAAATTDPVAEAVAAEVEAAVTKSLQEPAVLEIDTEATDGMLRWIDASAVNVREGPSTGFPVLGKLTRGEAVLVVPDESGGEGWSRVRIEGDGIEGFVATRLLTDAQP